MEYFKEKFKNFNNQKLVEQYFGTDEQKLIRDIKKYSAEDPLMNIYISDLLNYELKGIAFTDTELEKHVFTAIFNIKKGDKSKVFDRLKELRKK